MDIGNGAAELLLHSLMETDRSVFLARTHFIGLEKGMWVSNRKRGLAGQRQVCGAVF